MFCESENLVFNQYNPKISGLNDENISSFHSLKMIRG